MLLSAIRNKSSIFYLWILILFTLNTSVQLQKANSGENPTFFNIGGVLSNNESEKNFSETIAVSFMMMMMLVWRRKLISCATQHIPTHHNLTQAE